jgi:tetratricopeptide (TPR) repeat protein
MRARIDFDNKLDTVLVELQDGQGSQALQSLMEASIVGQENGYDQTQLKCLFVEAHLSVGNIVEAYNQAKELLEADSQDGFANELMGKICLREGGFGDAEKHFVRATEAYDNSDDISRANDLVALSRYFLAYEDGNPRLADGYLREIQNVDLQHAVDKAQKETDAQHSS